MKRQVDNFYFDKMENITDVIKIRRVLRQIRSKKSALEHAKISVPSCFGKDKENQPKITFQRSIFKTFQKGASVGTPIRRVAVNLQDQLNDFIVKLWKPTEEAEDARQGKPLRLSTLASFAVAKMAPMQDEDAELEEAWYSMIPVLCRRFWLLFNWFRMVLFQHCFEIALQDGLLPSILESLIDICVKESAVFQGILTF